MQITNRKGIQKKNNERERNTAKNEFNEIETMIVFE